MTSVARGIRLPRLRCRQRDMSLSRRATTFRDEAQAARAALWLTVFAAACLVLAPGDARPQAQVPPRAAFVANGCYQCHGYSGQGGAAGPRIAPSPYPFAAFAALVRRPGNVMPAYAESVLDDAALREIYAYVRSVPEPPPVEDIAALR